MRKVEGFSVSRDVILLANANPDPLNNFSQLFSKIIHSAIQAVTAFLQKINRKKDESFTSMVSPFLFRNEEIKFAGIKTETRSVNH